MTMRTSALQESAGSASKGSGRLRHLLAVDLGQVTSPGPLGVVPEISHGMAVRTKEGTV